MEYENLEIDEAFFSALAGEDDLGVVIRAQIHIESGLNEYISEKISDLKTLRQLRFNQRIELACDLGLNSELKSPLKKLGEMRNNFAHKIDANLSENDVDALNATFDEYTKAIFFQHAYEASESVMLKDIPSFPGLCP